MHDVDVLLFFLSYDHVIYGVQNIFTKKGIKKRHITIATTALHFTLVEGSLKNNKNILLYNTCRRETFKSIFSLIRH